MYKFYRNPDANRVKNPVGSVEGSLNELMARLANGLTSRSLGRMAHGSTNTTADGFTSGSTISSAERLRTELSLGSTLDPNLELDLDEHRLVCRLFERFRNVAVVVLTSVCDDVILNAVMSNCKRWKNPRFVFLFLPHRPSVVKNGKYALSITHFQNVYTYLLHSIALYFCAWPIL